MLFNSGTVAGQIEPDGSDNGHTGDVLSAQSIRNMHTTLKAYQIWIYISYKSSTAKLQQRSFDPLVAAPERVQIFAANYSDAMI